MPETARSRVFALIFPFRHLLSPSQSQSSARLPRAPVLPGELGCPLFPSITPGPSRAALLPRAVLRDVWTVARRLYRFFCLGSGWKPLFVK